MKNLLTRDELNEASGEKNLSSLAPKLTAAFSAWLALKDKPANGKMYSLKKELDALNKEARTLSGNKAKDAGLWWRFFKGDTGANTPESLLRALDGSTNYDFAVEQMQIAVDDPKGVSVYFT